MPRKDPLAHLERVGKLSPDGKAWLTQALDPFHDQPIEPVGYPDISADNTIVGCIESTYSISSNQGATANWDCHIFLMPDLISQLYYSMNATAGYPNSNWASKPQVTLGLLNAIGIPAGNNTFAIQGNSTGNICQNPLISCNVSPWDLGLARITGIGFEVVNTTAELYRQGAAIVYRQPNSNTVGTYTYNDAVSTPHQCFVGPAITSKLPPNNSSEALTLPNSRQWAASEGAYVVASFNNITNPLAEKGNFARTYTWPYGYYADATTTYTGVNSYTGLASGTPLIANATNDTTLNGFYTPAKPINIDTSGVYFTGLSAQTTLTVNLKIYVERAPSAQDAQLVNLARRSPMYDPLAFELYACVVDHLPAGCMLKDNPAGEWFESIIRSVRDNAPWVGQMLNVAGVPFGGRVGTVVGNMARLALGEKVKKGKKKQKEKIVVVKSKPSKGKAWKATSHAVKEENKSKWVVKKKK